MIKSEMTTNASFVEMLESTDKFLLDNVFERIGPPPDYITVDDVRIYPGSIIFNDAYDGKKFKKRIEIINSGTKIAFVRVLNPTTKVFKIKAVPNGKYLSAGMSIIRYIKHTFSTAMPIRKAMIPIYINEKHLVYNIRVFLSLPMVSLYPRVIDFGDIDLGDASEQLSVFLTNTGHKNAHYLVDLGRNDLEIIVEPMKGTIQPESSAEIKFELLGTREGCFNKEFWIKTVPIQRIRLMGTFITPKLEIIHPSDTKYSVTLVHFPKTYYGAESSKILVIKNSSSKPTMFCTVAEFQGETFDFEEARNINDAMKYFWLKPKEGRLTAKHEYVLTAYYVPKKQKPVSSTYHICFIRVNKVPFREGVVEEKEMEVKTFSSNLDLGNYIYTVASSLTLNEEPLDLKTLEDIYVRVCLYGETEEASVRLTPDAFESNDLMVNETHHYTFNIKNNSKELPITFRYNKVPFVEMKPPEMSLGPDRSVDVLLMITPKRMGFMEKNIVINLLFTNKDGKTYNVGTAHFRICFDAKMAVKKLGPKFVKGITPICTNEVGYLVDDVKFNSDIKKPIMAIVNPKHRNFNKDNDALIAFPNDRRRSLRPNRDGTTTKTIFTQIPRYVNNDDEYQMRPSEARRRNQSRDFYSNYLRRRCDQVPKIELSDYERSGKPALLGNPKVEKDCSKNKFDDQRSNHLEEIGSSHFIPLPPEKLMKIIIKPKYIALGKIAPFTSCTDSFSIENRNDFAVKISIKALCNSILIRGNKRIVINQKETKNIYFDCLSFGLGKYYVPVYIIVNDNHIFDATVFAEVVPRTLRCYQNEVILSSNDKIPTIVIHNPVNCNVDFTWEVQDKNFIVSPSSGYIPPRRNILCRIKSVPFVGAVLKTDMYLISESGSKQIIRVTCQNDKINLLYHASSISFENIPLNVAVTKILVVRNPSEKDVILQVLDSNPMGGITVTPQEKLMRSMSNAVFKITAHLQAVMEFKCKIWFRQQNAYQKEIDITGNVAYPNVLFSPSSIQFARVPSWTFQKATIVVKNAGVTRNTIDVDLSYYPGLSLTNTDLDPINRITLEPKESMSLYFLFQPSEPALYSLFLPYIINGIIGPPQLNNPKSLKSAVYYKYYSANTLGLLHEVINNNLPVVRARCTSGAPWILFSTLKIHFEYHNQNKTKTFKITNVHTNECSVILGKRHIGEEFTMGIEDSDKDYTECESYYKVSLKPQETVTFLVEFRPKDFGEFRVAIPILIDIFKPDEPFNFLFLSGFYPKHEINSAIKVLCFQNVPVKMKASTSLQVQYRNHHEDCKFIIKNDYSCFDVTLISKTSISSYDYTLEFRIQFVPTEEMDYSIKLEFSCTCEGCFCLYLKASANNSSLFRFKYPFPDSITSISGRPFPYVLQGFPMPNCEISIDNVIEILQNWMHTECFFYQNRYSIPDSISRYPFEVYCPEKKENPFLRNSSKRTVHLPIVQLIINTIDRSVEKYLTNSNSLEPDLNNTKGTQADYKIYKNVLTFLSSQNVFIDHIRPEFLLTYERYLIFKEKINDPDFPVISETLDENNFNIFSKVLWTELILRIYKRFSFDRTFSSPDHPMTCPFHDEFEKFLSSKLPSKSEGCTEDEFRLLKWIEFHYERKKTVLLTEKYGKSREFNSFDAKTVSSLAIMTILISFCPYVLDHMKDVYPAPNHISQMLHNSFILRKVLDSLGFMIRCKHLDHKRTDFHQIMLLTYLYGVLPNFYPSQDLEVKAKLGETGCCEISVKHFEHIPIGYIATIFGNELGEFEVSDRTIIIPPNQIKKIKIRYSAKEIKKTKAVLVLSGESAGQRFATSMVYTIHGIPDITHHSAEFFFAIPLYQLTSHDLRLTSPCAKNYVAKTYIYVYFAKDILESLGEKLLSSSDITEMCLPRQIVIDDTCVFDESGLGIVKMKTCLIVNTLRCFYLYFINKDAGIFCVKVGIKCIADDRITETINVKLASNFEPTEKCICKTDILNGMCPLVFNVEIPCRNNLLMKALRSMFVNFAKEEEIQFWNQHLVFPKGIHLLRTYLENTFPPEFNTFRDILFQTVKYNTVNDTELYKTESSFVIEDVTSESCHKLAVHWLSDKFPTDHVITLKADHGLEIRKYKFKFISKNVPVKNKQ